ncbi:MAG: hypothetical protein R3245_09490 [Kiloniellales bacterium]|nr:hypothetical protein [Kiloniellales bacterium]
MAWTTPFSDDWARVKDHKARRENYCCKHEIAQGLASRVILVRIASDGKLALVVSGEVLQAGDLPQQGIKRRSAVKSD